MLLHHPHPVRSFLNTVSELLKVGKAAEAWALLEPALAVRSTDFNLLNLSAAAAAASGRPETAESLWRQAVALAPHMARGYYNLATLLTELGRGDEAVALYRQALVLHDGDADCHNNLAAVLIERGQLDAAESSCQAALQRQPGHVGARVNLGMVYARQGHVALAEQQYRTALAKQPHHANALSNLGALLAEAGQSQAAWDCYQQALAAEANHPLAWSNLGALLCRRHQFSAAESCLRWALKLAPNNAEALCNLGQALAGQGQKEAAEVCHRRALELEPQSAEIRDHLAGLLSSGARQQEALVLYQEALRLKPQAAAIRSNLGALQANLGDIDAALSSLRQAVACNPNYARANINLGYLYLALGRFAEGWHRHELRYHPTLPYRDMEPPEPTFPQWRGEDLRGKSILIWPEQGLGDEIQFCRYAPVLKNMGVSQLSMVCKPELQTVLKTLAGVDRLFSHEEALAQIPEHDYWALTLSAPMYCRTVLETIPANVPYLYADDSHRQRWQSRLPSGGLRVGLVWRGHKNHANDARRSLPGLSLLKPLWTVPGIQFVSLQKGAAEDEAANPPADQPLLHLGSEFQDFADTAAVMEAMDLLICVDTSSAHMAGALGRPCWVLLPHYNCDWRWMREREDSPWYPTMRLFRQPHDGDWVSVIARVERALRKWAAAQASMK